MKYDVVLEERPILRYALAIRAASSLSVLGTITQKPRSWRRDRSCCGSWITYGHHSVDTGGLKTPRWCASAYEAFAMMT